MINNQIITTGIIIMSVGVYCLVCILNIYLYRRLYKNRWNGLTPGFSDIILTFFPIINVFGTIGLMTVQDFKFNKISINWFKSLLNLNSVTSNGIQQTNTTIDHQTIEHFNARSFEGGFLDRLDEDKPNLNRPWTPPSNSNQDLYNWDEVRHLAVCYSVYNEQGGEKAFNEWFEDINPRWREMVNGTLVVDSQ